MYKSPLITLLLIAFFIPLTSWIDANQKIILFTDKKLSQIEKTHGVEALQRFIKWQQLIGKNQTKTNLEKIKLTNDFFNQQLLWVADLKLWKKNDYWATPMETLIKRAGDCEDFTIIKYFTLISLGVPISHLKLTYVKAIKYNQAHMVLTYSETKRSIPLILDNINKKILPANERTDLKPVYSFNGEGLWLQKQKKLGQKVGSSSRIRLWVDLNKRMKKELI